MKVALLSESPADEAALRLIVEGVLGHPVEPVQPPLRARGWPSVAQVLPIILRHLHFQTDTAGIVVAVDADDSVVHTGQHEQSGYFHPQCRLCSLRAIVRQTLRKLPPARGRDRLFSAVGLAVPAIEAWYLCGRDESVGEAAWLAGREQGTPPYTRRELKQRVYGTSFPSLPLEVSRAEIEIGRHRGDFRRLEFDFPAGFGLLAADLRRWPNSTTPPEG
jgi:hypothetical protein